MPGRGGTAPTAQGPRNLPGRADSNAASAERMRPGKPIATLLQQSDILIRRHRPERQTGGDGGIPHRYTPGVAGSDAPATTRTACTGGLQHDPWWNSAVRKGHAQTKRWRENLIRPL